MSIFDLIAKHLTKTGVASPDGTDWYDSPTDAAKSFATKEMKSVQPSVDQPSSVQIPDADGAGGSDAYAQQQEEPSALMRLVNPSFAEASTGANGQQTANSPKLTKKGALMSLVLGAGKGAAVGSSQRNFGEGFQAAQEAPIQLQRGKLENLVLGAQAQREQAQADQLKTQVTLPNGVTLPFALAKMLYPTMVTEQGKNSRNTQNVNSRESIAGGKNAIALRKQGLTVDENGKQVPIPYDQLTPSEQGAIDLKQSQQDAASARADLDRAKNDPNSAAYKAAWGRLTVARQNAATAAGKLGLDVNKFNADYFGTAPGGDKLPGFSNDQSTGLPISPKAASAGKVAADRLRRGDLAANGIQNADNIGAIVARRPDLFGPAYGRWTNIRQLTGNNDKDIAALGTEIHNLALASNGAHGVRSSQAVAQTENEILNHFHNGPGAVVSALSAMKGSLNTFVNDQKLGSRARPSSPNGTTPQATTAPASVQPSPQTHVFDVKAWKAANPKGDAGEAIKQATRLGYQVIQ